MKLTITTLVIIEGSYIPRNFHYFLDTFTSTDKYEQIMEIYANPR